MRCRLLAIAALLVATWPALADESGRAGTFLNVAGSVVAAGLPVDDALVIAFGLSQQYDERANTDTFGEFSLAPLPLGVYRVIAVKRGFAPAVAMVAPGRKEHRLSLRLRAERSLSRAERDDVWEIRRSLPRDILREVDQILGATEESEPQPAAAFAGDVMSVQGFDTYASARTADRTSLMLRGGVGDWSVDLEGRRQSIGTEDAAAAGDAEAADVALELRAPRGGAYRIATSSASWPGSPGGLRPDTALENHSIVWKGSLTTLSLRYFERENVFAGETGPSDGVEIEGNRTVYRSERAGIGVQLRVAEETASYGLRKDESTAYAEVLAAGDFRASKSFNVGYGLLTRAGRYGGVDYVPQAAASLGSTRFARITVSGAYKVASDGSGVHVAPVVTEMGRIPVGEARYRYGVALTRELGRTGTVTASATMAEADNAAYVFFDDRFEEFWDGLYVEPGDESRAVALAASVASGGITFGVDASAGTIDAPEDASESHREYVVASLRASRDGSGTSIDVAYRRIGQPLVDDARIRSEIERISVVLAQSLRLPVDVRLMVGMALTREEEAGEQAAAERDATRLVGGLAFSF